MPTLIETVANYANSHPYKTREELEQHIKTLSEQAGVTDFQVYNAIKNARRSGMIHDTGWGKFNKGRSISNGGCTVEPENASLLSLFKNTNQIQFKDVLERLDLSPSMLRSMIDDYRSHGTEIYEHDDMIRFGVPEQSKAMKPLAEKEIIFGVASDLHFGAKACQITALKKFCDECKREGVTHILVPGDIVDGSGVYKGQELEQYATMADEQEQSVIQNLPTGFQWIVLGGNHDWSFMAKGRGHNPLRAIETQREDVCLIGYDRETVPLLPGVDAILWHGRGGSAYAKSYKLQNEARNIAFSELRQMMADNKPAPTVRFLFGGHYHIFCYTIEGGIHCYFCGSFEGSNGLTNQMGVDPVICGLLIHATIKRGSIVKSRVDVLEYPEIKDDYKNYKHAVTYSRPEAPIFA